MCGVQATDARREVVVPVACRDRTRPASVSRPSRAFLEELYCVRRLSMARIAANLDVTRRTVGRWLAEVGIPTRSRHLEIEGRERVLLEELYVTLGLSTYEIAGLMGLSREQVSRRLRRLGIPLRPRGRGGRRRTPRLLPPGPLEELYVRRRLTIEQVAGLLGVTPSVVKASLRAHGVPIRTRGRCNREDRFGIDPKVLERLYVEEERSADEIGRMFGVSRNVVLRTAHDYGIPVWTGGTRATRTPRIRLLDALYDEPAVREVLRRHGVPVRRTHGALWERFPVPVPLTPTLLEDLYVGHGLSARQVELLTGQPSETVRRRLCELGIRLRPPGGRSPLSARLLREADCGRPPRNAPLREPATGRYNSTGSAAGERKRRAPRRPPTRGRGGHDAVTIV